MAVCRLAVPSPDPARRREHGHRRERTIKGGTGGVGKTAVMGLLDRHGPDGHSTVRTTVLTKAARKDTLQPVVREHVQPGTQLCTDAHSGYVGLNAEYIHAVIDHAEKYVEGNVHTNGLENFWALFKRCIKGTHVFVEPFHLFRYLDAQAFRFNSRKKNDGARFNGVVESIAGKRLTYKGLIGATENSLLGDSGAASGVAS